MFTGLVECTARVTGLRRSGEVVELVIGGAPIDWELKRGDSVSVSGACLSVVARERGGFTVQMMPETSKNTILGNVKPGYRVNLERAMPASGRLEGHIVTGHVDLVSQVVGLVDLGRSRELDFSLPPEAARFVARKGSIAVQGVSLTVISSEAGQFRVGLIPETLADTTLGDLRIGDPVNVEYDILSKYLVNLLEKRTLSPKGGLTLDNLAEMGWS
ncbi:MAG: Riboflavin synthase [Synergistetes bacterium ADurb.Bin155]|jgi:riboflavin synthase|nr:riboflavin synthase [Synergistales bacterium]NMD18197.1 riboflavin synthase [Synergistaceae bacterium]OQB47296.1 MAG: Riboflavin synthase [Synergistetes bacterium ADurb.Bin155]MBP8995083.1 riboflavin synthase [Synergistales bacterium]HOC81977.1 riboflavin synthase [Synergistales bacterium]